MFLEFSKNRYLKTLLGFFGIVLLYCLCRVIFQSRMPRLNSDAIKSALLLYIMAYQGLRSAPAVRRICMPAVFLLVTACIFKIMNWPFASPFLVFSFSVSYCCLLLDALKSPVEKKTELILLSFAPVHVVSLLSHQWFPGARGFFWNLEAVWVAAIIVYLCFAVFVKREGTKS